MNVKQGDICIYKGENEKEEYCIIISSDLVNKYAKEFVNIIPIKTKKNEKQLPSHIRLFNNYIGFNMGDSLYAQVEEIQTINSNKLIGMVGHWNRELEQEINDTLVIINS
jgi:mRNA-degrading endonuclease toxin of MazEF toxin-antitoxin module